MKKIIGTLMLCAALTGCTAQQRAKNFGGTATERLPAGQKLVNITWKDDHLWILTRPMSISDVLETYSFQERASYGVMQGTVTVVESK